MNLATRGLGRSRQLLSTGGIGRFITTIPDTGPRPGGGESHLTAHALALREDEEILVMTQALFSRKKH